MLQVFFSLIFVALHTSAKKKKKNRRIKLHYTKMVSLQYNPDATQCVKRCNLLAKLYYTLPLHVLPWVWMQSTGHCSPPLTISSMLSDSCRTCYIHKAEGHTAGQWVLIAKPQTLSGTWTVRQDLALWNLLNCCYPVTSLTVLNHSRYAIERAIDGHNWAKHGIFL
jgi:hypothetical protein